jgi:TRAP-type C4-dicarboxylate transport system permease small subunit
MSITPHTEGFIYKIAVYLQNLCAFVLLPLLALIVCLDVVARYIFNSPLAWASDLTTILLLCTFMSAIPICTAQDGHIRVETFYEDYSLTKSSWADLIGDLMGLFFMGLLTIRSYLDVPKFFVRGERSDMINIPHWIVAAFVGTCAVATCIVLLGRMTQALKQIFAEQKIENLTREQR